MKTRLFFLVIGLLVYSSWLPAQEYGLFSTNSSHFIRSGKTMELFELETGKRISSHDLENTYGIRKASSKVLTHDAKFLVVVGRYQSEGKFTMVLDLEKQTVVKKLPFPQERKWVGFDDQYLGIPNSQDFISYYRPREETLYAELIRYSCESADWEPVSRASVKCPRDKEIKKRVVPELGEVYMDDQGKFIAIQQDKGYFKHDLLNLEAKPQKLDLPSGYFLSPDLTTCLEDRQIHSTSITPSKTGVSWEEYSFINTENHIYYSFDEDPYKKKYGAILRFDYVSGKQLPQITNEDWHEKIPRISPINPCMRIFSNSR